MEPQQASMAAKDWMLLVGLGTLWGGSFFFAKVALAELPPLVVVLSRVGIAAPVLALAMLGARQRMPRSVAGWRALVVIGALNNALPFCLIVWAQSHIASGLASILNAMTPLFTVVAAHVLTTDERMSAAKLGAVGLGIGGAAAVIGPDALRHLGENVISELACLAAALCYACAAIYGRRFRRLGMTPLATAAGQVIVAALLLLPAALVANPPASLPWPSAVAWGAMLGSALFCTALGYLVYFRLLASAGATNLMLVTFLTPVSAITLGTVFLGEGLEPRHYLGMALIMLALAIVDGRLIARLRGRPAMAD
jgi:drug/metabolite transporter (DMT)-like permease